MAPKASGATTAGNDVETFLAALDHPAKSEILSLRALILGVDPSVAEGIKWNAPSFRTTEYFATFHLRAKEGVQIILHRGAKRRSDGPIAIPDPHGLLEWLGEDRASVRFRDQADVAAKGAAFADVLRHWIKTV
ncbi:MAG TPA: DUF1801 domain-containing protein [Candidatus Kapabacteria bacterium]|jgi:hypothetical protein|nr:DUF1801 domain-containing protein [Candidatus Kapabacteria bacterium]